MTWKGFSCYQIPLINLYGIKLPKWKVIDFCNEISENVFTWEKRYNEASLYFYTTFHWFDSSLIFRRPIRGTNVKIDWAFAWIQSHKNLEWFQRKSNVLYCQSFDFLFWWVQTRWPLCQISKRIGNFTWKVSQPSRSRFYNSQVIFNHIFFQYKFLFASD